MRTIENIIVHCADTPNGKSFTVQDIDSWHIQRGWHRYPNWIEQFNSNLKAIGYHFVIYVDGSVHTGRNIEEIGAHCQGANTTSIGICMIGKDKFTQEQWDALAELVGNLKNTYHNASVHGHYEFASAVEQGKTCPNFDVPSWATDFTPDDDHVL